MTADVPTVQFGELPPDGRGQRFEWASVAEKLQAQPGDWAKVITKGSVSSASQTAHAISRARIIAFRPSGQYEATTRGLDVWARFVGGGAS